MAGQDLDKKCDHTGAAQCDIIILTEQKGAHMECWN